MALILNIETATKTCSVALGKEGKVEAAREVAREHFSHAEELTLLVQELLEQEGYAFRDLDALAVGAGPGSYTGLRIGVSTVKGLAYALKLPLIGLRTLRVMAHGKAVKETLPEEARIVPMLDARRDEVYCSVHDRRGNTLEAETALELRKDPVPGIEGVETLYFIGSGAEKARDFLDLSAEAHFYPEEAPSAKNMVEPAESAFQKGDFEDPFSFEPFYLKDFVPTVPKK